MNQTRKVVIVGFGNIGQAVVPLLRTAFPEWRVTVVEQQGDRMRLNIAAQFEVSFIECRVTEANFVTVLRPLLEAGDMLLNLAHAVSSEALIRFAQEVGALYLDTGIEPWEYVLATDSETSNYALRERMLTLKRERAGQSTALVAHGANPGFVSILVKAALLDMAKAALPEREALVEPVTRMEWAALAAALDIRVIQISEFDTQRAHADAPRSAFVNTWSVEGFVAECMQEAELGWGTHENAMPPGAHAYAHGCRAAIRLATRGHETIVKSWTPLRGEFSACVLTHNESISIADYLTSGPPDAPTHRPTVFYAYRPIDAAVESLHRSEKDHAFAHGPNRVFKHELVDGEDELGVLLMSGNGTSLWLGSALSIQRTRGLAPLNNATSLQVASAIVGGLRWMIGHPNEGIVESDELDHVPLLDSVLPYWEPMQRCYTNWQPSHERRELTFSEFLLPQRRLESSLNL